MNGNTFILTLSYKSVVSDIVSAWKPGTEKREVTTSGLPPFTLPPQ